MKTQVKIENYTIKHASKSMPSENEVTCPPKNTQNVKNTLLSIEDYSHTYTYIFIYIYNNARCTNKFH